MNNTVYSTATDTKLAVVRSKAQRRGFDARQTTDVGDRSNGYEARPGAGVVLFPNEECTASRSCIAFRSIDDALAYLD